MNHRTLSIAILIALVSCTGCKDKSPGTDDPPSETPPVAEKASSTEAVESPAGPATEDEEAAESEPEEPTGPALMALGRPDARLKVKSPAPVKYNKAKKAHKDKDLDTATTLLDEALEADPLFTWALLLRARIHIQKGETEQCAEKLERLLAYNFIEYAPRIKRLAWLKPFRDDPEAWPAFEQTMEDYREAWIEALSGSGAFFVQSQYKKIQQTDPDGEVLDLKWRRGSPMFWSADLVRFLVISEYTDVAAFLVDDDHLIVVRFATSDDEAPGMMTDLTAQRIDLSEAQLEGKPIKLADEAELARFGLDEDGNLLFELKLIDEEEEEAGDDDDEEADDDEEEEAGDDDDEEAGDDDEEEADDDDDEEAGDDDDEEAGDDDDEAGDDDEEEADDDEEDDEESGFEVDRVNWSKKRVDSATMSEDDDWLLLVTLLDSDGPAPASDADAPDETLKVKRDGACLYLDSERGLCFEPTKKGGTWTNLYLHLPDSEPVNLTSDDPIPVVQF